MLNPIKADQPFSANPGEYSEDPRILNQQSRTNNGVRQAHRLPMQSLSASSSSATIGRPQATVNVFKQASDRLVRNSGVIEHGIASPLAARPNFFEQIHKLSFDESLMISASDKSLHADVIKLVNELEYSDLNVLKNNISTTPRLAVDKLKCISGSAHNPAQTYASNLLEQHIHKDAYNNQRWWDESIVARQFNEAAWALTAATGVSAVTYYTHPPSSNNERTGTDLRAAGTIFGAVAAAAVRMPALFFKNHWDGRVVQNNNKLHILNILLTQRKSGIDALDSIYYECQKKGVFNDDYESVEGVNRDNLNTIRQAFSDYKPSQSYHLYSKETSQDDRTKKYFGKLVLGDKTLKINHDIARLLSDIKDLGLDYVLREGTAHAYDVYPLSFRPRGRTNESLIPRPRLPTRTRSELAVISPTTIQETRETEESRMAPPSRVDRARQSVREGDIYLDGVDV
ncbi:hypothetical protein [Brucella intermedia]|uniref:hypothetical protein n=1 Tax=Brucella intermedia TaxID=94625 RepID=UPI00236164B5|nr:hypothetical protein [Brucella intermedia]